MPLSTLSAFPLINILGVASSSTATSVAPTSSGALIGSGVTLQTKARSAVLFLNISQVSPSSSHTLDVYAQASPDGGTTYDDFVHFAQVPGKTPTTSTQVAQWIRDWAGSSSTSGNIQSVRTTAVAGLAASLVLQGPVGATWRGYAVATGASSSIPWQLTLSAQLGQ